jgi:hypothetical protein
LREEQRLRVFENRVLRRIFGPKSDEATGDWRRLHNEELNDPMRHVWGRREVHTGFWWGDPREGDHLGDPGVGGRIILRWIFGKWDGRT